MSIQVIVNAINSTGVAEVVDIQDGKNRVTITHRVVKNQLRIWLGIIKHVLAHKHGWDAFVAKQYFLRNDGELIYCWKIIAQWADETLDVHRQIASLVQRASNEIPRGGAQLDSYPLVAKDSRNAPQSGINPRASGPMTGGLRQKGAHKIGGRM